MCYIFILQKNKETNKLNQIKVSYYDQIFLDKNVEVIYYHMLKKLNLLQKKSKVLKKETSTKTKFIGIVFDYFNRGAKSKMEI